MSSVALRERRRWIQEDEYRLGVALAQIMPGPLAAQLAIALGYFQRGVLGATAVGLAFVLPSFLMVIALSIAYRRFGGLWWMQALFCFIQKHSRGHRAEKETDMKQAIAPIAVRPWTLNGMSERLIVSHYENNYGGAVSTLNAVRDELAALDARAPAARVRALKREELMAMGSVALHELYFGNLGGEGNKIPDPAATLLEEHFGSVAAWRRDFVGTAQSLAGGSGWTPLTFSRRPKRLWNQIAFDQSQAAVDAAPGLALDMYEHAYHLDFGANAVAYVDAFMRNVNWAAVIERIAAVRADRPLPQRQTPAAALAGSPAPPFGSVVATRAWPGSGRGDSSPSTPRDAERRPGAPRRS